ncbi:MAG: hypothetical protein C0606_04995 [Hyphomicrobiales bacterium]|nr:MAG: hypothetical protein C0606_04995 [Hyphomicrobiales bacterium]
MAEPKRYVGIDNDVNGGMTDTGKIIRDAWIFGLIEESETCAGWTAQGIESLWTKVSARWEEYGFLVSNLPPEMRERFDRIQSEAIERARAAGWNPDRDVAADE